jgi:transposase
MEEHIRALLQHFQYSEQFKETAAFRIVFGGEILSQVMANLDIHNSYALRNWVSLYQRKLQTRLFVSPSSNGQLISGRDSWCRDWKQLP